MLPGRRLERLGQGYDPGSAARMASLDGLQPRGDGAAPPTPPDRKMPREVIAERTAEVELDWLDTLNITYAARGLPRVDFDKVTIPEGSSVYMDEDGPRFRMKTPKGKIVAWDRFKRLLVEPGEYWGIKWRSSGQVDDPDFGFSMTDGKLTILLENMDGQEHLFEDFVATFSDPDMCPGGFRPPDGRYKSNTLMDYMVKWGGDGVPPSLTPVREVTPDVRPDDPAARFIEIAEAVFLNPTDIVRARWSRKEGEFIFSRPAHEFTDYDKFVFQFAMILTGLGQLSREEGEEFVASAVHAGGKCQIDGTPRGDVGNFVAVHSLVKDGNANYVPKPLSARATTISQLIARQQATPASPGLRKWLARYVSPPPGSTPQDSMLFSEEGGPYALPLGKQSNGKTLYYVGETSLLTVAPSGKGKTQCHILPTLARYRGPAIVLDIKSECFQHTAEWRKEEVGRVIRFNPVEPELSSRYNPLAFVDDAPDELWESSRFLADLLVVTHNKTDLSWESQGRDLVTLLIAYVTAFHEPEDRHMGRVLDLVATIGLEDMLAMVSARESPFPSSMRRIAARMHQMMKNAPKQFEGVLSGASQHLQLWEGSKLERATSASDWKPEDFRSAPYPTLYICIPPNAMDTYAPVMRVIIGQHVRRLMRTDTSASAPILFLLDELPRLGKMAPIREALEVGRSYGIKLWMVAQYPEQLTAAYAEVGEGMMESCDVRMYMNPTAATAERLAKAFGKSRNVLDSSRKQMLEAAEILGPEHRDSIFVLAANEQPQILLKDFYYRGQ